LCRNRAENFGNIRGYEENYTVFMEPLVVCLWYHAAKSADDARTLRRLCQRSRDHAHA